MRFLLLAPFAALLGLAALQESARPARELRLVYLANEGFLLRAGGTSVVIDAFVTEPYAGYASVPPELFQEILDRRAPYEHVDLALASHAHRDHFQPEAAARFLAAHPETDFLSSVQVLGEMDASAAGEPGRPRAFLPEPGKTLEVRTEPVRVELLRLPHAGGERNASVQNLGHRFELGGVRVLHVGDADPEAGVETLAGYDLARHPVDVALVPYWWLGDARSVARAYTLAGAARLVAVHVPPNEVASVQTRLAALDPRVLVFSEPGEERILELDSRPEAPARER